MLFAYLCWQFVSWTLFFNGNWAKAVRMKNFLSQSSEAIKLLEKVLFTPWHMIVFFNWGFWPLSWRMETSVDWSSGLSFRAKYRSLAWQHLFLVSLKPFIINECGALVVGRIKSWENQQNATDTEIFFRCKLLLSTTKFYFSLLLKVIYKLWIAIFFKKKVKIHIYELLANKSQIW